MNIAICLRVEILIYDYASRKIFTKVAEIKLKQCILRKHFAWSNFVAISRLLYSKVLKNLYSFFIIRRIIKMNTHILKSYIKDQL